MSSLLVILIGTVLVNTFLLMQNDEALGGSRHTGSIANAIRIGGATAIVVIAAALLAGLAWQALSEFPHDTALFFYALLVVAIAVALDRLSKVRFPIIGRALASSPLLVVSNSLALGSVLLPAVGGELSGLLTMAVGLALSFIAALAIFTALISRIAVREVPQAFRRSPITFVSAGLLALALMGFTGLIRG